MRFDTYIADVIRLAELRSRMRREGYNTPYKGTIINVPFDDYQRMTFQELLDFCERRFSQQTK